MTPTNNLTNYSANDQNRNVSVEAEKTPLSRLVEGTLYTPNVNSSYTRISLDGYSVITTTDFILPSSLFLFDQNGTPQSQWDN